MGKIWVAIPPQTPPLHSQWEQYTTQNNFACQKAPTGLVDTLRLLRLLRVLRLLDFFCVLPCLPLLFLRVFEFFFFCECAAAAAAAATRSSDGNEKVFRNFTRENDMYKFMLFFVFFILGSGCGRGHDPFKRWKWERFQNFYTWKWYVFINNSQNNSCCTVSTIFA